MPIFEDQPFFVWLTGKYAAYRSETLVFSPLVSFDIFTADGDTVISGALGALLDVILGDRGQGAVSFGLIAAFPLSVSDSISNDLDLFDDIGLLLNVSFSWEVARIVKLLLEVDLPAGLHNGEFDVAEGVLINYGVRFFNETFAGDIAFVRPVGGDGDDPFILGFPLATFTVRF
jgi:hypothetical protein